MYCPHCGNSIQDQSKFCGRCGNSLTPLTANYVAVASSSADEGRKRLLICLGLSFFIILGLHDLAIFPAVLAIFVFVYRKQIPAPYGPYLLGVLLFLAVGYQSFVMHGYLIEESTAMPEPEHLSPQTVQLPTVPPPKYILFKQKKDDVITFVVPANTTEDQLKSLVWLFRQKVRSGQFKDIGITVPTAKQWGVDGYDSGLLDIYRGTKCADQPYITSERAAKEFLARCGWGEHDDASYQWGISGDPQKDAGDVRATDGMMKTVFDYNDNWQPPAKK